MNLLEASIHTPLAKMLGWSLVHFLWEGALIALLLGVLLLLSGPGAARLRYAFCCLAMLAMPLAFAVTVALMLPAAHSPAALVLPPAPPPDAGEIPAGTQAGNSLLARVSEAMPWAVPFWMAGVLIFYLRSVGGWMAAQRLRRTGVCVAPADWQQRLHGLRERLGLAKPVMLLESCLVDVPVVIGFLRPAILMPVGLLAGLSTDQLESILVHELAHIRRRDYVVNLLQSFVESLLFYHPAVWWVSNLVRAEREHCCDDVAVELKGDARAYAAALATLENNRWPAREPALAATGGSLMRRIQRLLEQPQRPRPAAAPIFATGLLIVSFGVILGGWQARPAAAPLPAPTPRPQAVDAPARAPGRALPLVAQVRPVPKKPAPDPEVADTPYRKWLNQDVAYIIMDAERSAFNSLTSDEEREHFIEQFWLRRDPTPGTPANEFKEEYYRRIAYANKHFASKIAGWKTDRGRIYIIYGPPDEIESHPTGGAYQRPAAEGGGTTATFPFERWRYRWIEGMGADVVVEFVDPTMTGEYHMTVDPSEKDAQRLVTPPPAAAAKAGATIRAMGNGGAMVSIPLTTYAGHPVSVVISIVNADRLPVANFQDRVEGPAPVYAKFVALRAGTYRMVVIVKDTVTNTVANDDIPFDVK